MKKLLLALFLSVFSYIAYAPCLNFEAEEMTQLKLKHNLLVQISPTLDKIKYSENVQNIPLISPLDTCYLDRITSNFGYRQHPVLGCYLFHTGVDLSSPIGTTVVSTANGYVTEIGKHKYGYGNYVIINHENGYMTRYAHLKSIIVKPGQRVTVSQPIGISGKTGLTTGPHLHYEIIKDSIPIDPVKFVVSDRSKYIEVLKKIQEYENTIV